MRPRCTKARRRQQAKPSEPPAPGIVGEADVAPATGPAADQDRWVGTRFLAELLGVSPPTVLSWERQRLLPPAVRIGRFVRWRKGAVLRWLGEREAAAARGVSDAD